MITQKELKEKIGYCQKTGLFKWRKSSSNRIHYGDTAGCIKPNSYVSINVSGTEYLAHRLAWLYVYGVWPVHEIDHVNGNPLDNRIANLREATRAENCRNTKLKSSNRSGFKGVFWNNQAGKWHARICVNYKLTHIGFFKAPKAASIAYKKIASKLFGKFTRA